MASENIHADEKRAIIRRKVYENEVLKVLEQKAPQIISGENKQRIPESLVNELVHLLNDSSQGFEKNRAKHNFLIRILILGQKELEWQVKVPPPIAKINNQHSTISTNTFEQYQVFQDVLENYKFLQKKGTLSALNNSFPKGSEESKQFQWGLILFNLIVFDGILDKLVLQLLTSKKYSIWIEGNYAWLTFFEQEDEVTKKMPPRRRYFISSATAALLFQFYENHEFEDSDNSILLKKLTPNALNFFLSKIGFKPLKINEFIKINESAYQLHLPPYLLSFSKGTVKHKNISDERLVQILRGLKVSNKEYSDVDKSENKLTKQRPVVFKKPGDSNPSIFFSEKELSKFKKALNFTYQDKRKTHKEVSDIIQKWIDLEGFAPILSFYAGWLQSLNTRQSTKYQYLTDLSSHLLIFYGTGAVDENSFEALNACYEEILDNCVSITSRNKKSVLIYRFHRFLIHHTNLPNVELSEGDDVEQGDSGTHADFITETEFTCIKKMFVNDSSDFKKENLYILFLMYRAGLRISEAVSIRIKDVHFIRVDGLLRANLLVRNNEYVENKTGDSRRNLPLNFLFLEEELEEFYIFFEQKKRERGLNKMLFSEDADGQRPLNTIFYYNILRYSFSQICGISTLVAHILRHSLASHFMLQLHQTEFPISSPVHLAYFKKMFFTGDSKSYLYFVSYILGHASPATTLSNYIHIQDLLLHHFLSDLKFFVKEEDDAKSLHEENFKGLIEILNIKPELYRKWRSRYGDLNRAINKGYLRNNKTDINDDFFEKIPDIITEIKKQLKAPVDLSYPDFVSLLEYRDHFKSSIIADANYGLTDGSYDRIQNSIKQIMMSKVFQKKTTTREPAYRHFSIKGLGEDRKQFFTSLKGETLQLMSPPVLPYDRDDAAKIFNNVIEGIKEDLLNKVESTIKQLQFFHKNHRAREGYILMKDVAEATSFVDWLLTLSQNKKTYQLTHLPSSLSSIPANKQLIFWRKSISSTSKKLQLVSSEPSSKYKKDYGTSKLKFLKSEDDDKSFRGAQGLKYALVLCCMVCHASGFEFE